MVVATSDAGQILKGRRSGGAWSWSVAASGTRRSLNSVRWGDSAHDHFVIAGSGGVILDSTDCSTSGMPTCTWTFTPSGAASGLTVDVLAATAWNGSRFVVGGWAGTVPNISLLIYSDDTSMPVTLQNFSVE
ncbi:MAG TPA: hypothetical protein VF132_13705 [Rudaea sp.]